MSIFKAFSLPIRMIYISNGSNYFTFHFASAHFTVHIISIDFLQKKEKKYTVSSCIIRKIIPQNMPHYAKCSLQNHTAIPHKTGFFKWSRSKKKNFKKKLRSLSNNATITHIIYCSFFHFSLSIFLFL